MKTPILQPIYFMIALMLFTIINIQAENNAPPVTLHVATAGTLPSMISASEKNQITDLKLTGKLNGTDIRYIREMAGRDYTGQITNGSLVNLDIAGCDIVSGGEGYYRRSSSIYSTSSNTISNYMFYECNLTSIAIPNRVTSIRSDAFEGCTSLKEFILAESNNNYSTLDGVLLNKNKTTLVCCPNAKGGVYSVPEGVRSIDNNAFYKCINLTSITLPNSLTSIGERAFYGCVGLTGNLNIPNTITSIGTSAFYGCAGLTGNLNIPNTITSIEDKVFYGCVGLTGNLNIPNTVTSIGTSAFYGCAGLTGNLNIPNTVTNIEDKVFYGCVGLTGNLNIPNSVISIGNSAFYGCAGLTGNLNIPNSVTSIREKAFYGCKGLTSLIIPNSVSTIGQYAFSNCSLKNVIFEDATTALSFSYSEKAFENCPIESLHLGRNIIYNSTSSPFRGITSLTLLTFGDLVTSIGRLAFYGCVGLTGNLNIPKSVTSIGDQAFYSCTGLTGNLNIPNSVTSIREKAFYGCTGFTSITLGNGLTSIGDETFYDCISLAGNLNIPNSVTSIGTSAFSGCAALTSITIGNGLKSIGSSTFLGCTSLEEFSVDQDNQYYRTLDKVLYSKDKTSLICYPNAKGSVYSVPEGVRSINHNAFYKCINLSSITLPNSLTSIGSSAFSGCMGLTSITLPNSLTSIESSAFLGCMGLTSITLPNSLASIGSRTFSDCIGLTSIIIGNSITSIGESAFAGCIELSSIYCYPTTPPLLLEQTVLKM